MNPWLLLLTIIGWIIVVVVSIAIVLFVVIFLSAVIKTVREGLAEREKNDNRRTVLMLRSQPDPEKIADKIDKKLKRQS